MLTAAEAGSACRCGEARPHSSAVNRPEQGMRALPQEANSSHWIPFSFILTSLARRAALGCPARRPQKGRLAGHRQGPGDLLLPVLARERDQVADVRLGHQATPTGGHI